jgi:hypothetical protein
VVNLFIRLKIGKKDAKIPKANIPNFLSGCRQAQAGIIPINCEGKELSSKKEASFFYDAAGVVYPGILVV